MTSDRDMRPQSRIDRSEDGFGRTERRARGEILIERPELYGLLKKAFLRRVTVVVAPAGYGKTAAVRNALASMDTSFMWFAGGSAEKSIVDVVNLLCTDISETAIPTSTADRPIDAYARLFGKVVKTSFPDGVHIVLDGLNRSPIEPDILEFLRSSMTVLPESAHIVLVSTGTPQIGLLDVARQMQLAHIGIDRLAFTEQETRSLLARAWGSPLSEDLVAEIFQVTRGWPQGLQAVVRIFSSPPESLELARGLGMLDTFSPDEEWITAQTADDLDRELVLSLAFFPSFHLKDAHTITGIEGSITRVREIVESHPQFVRVGSDEYVIESEFRSQLLAMAERNWSKGRIASHRQLVGSTLESRGAITDSLRMFLLAKDKEASQRVLDKLGGGWMLENDPATFLDLADGFDTLGISNSATRFACAEAATIRGDFVSCLRHADEGLKDTDPMLDIPLSLLAARARDRGAGTPNGISILTIINETSGEDEHPEWVQLFLIDEQIRRGEYQSAEESIRRLSASLNDESSAYIQDSLSLLRTALFFCTGRYATALNSLRRVTLEILRLDTIAAFKYHQLNGLLLAFQGDHDSAQISLQRVRTIAMTLRSDLSELLALLRLSNLAVQRGDLKDARAWYGEAESLSTRFSSDRVVSQVVISSRARLEWLAGSHDSAISSFGELKTGIRGFGSEQWDGLYAAHAFLRTGAFETAMETLGEIQHQASARNASHVEANALLLLAYGAQGIQDHEASSRWLEQCWRQMDTHGHRFMPASDPEIVLWADRRRSKTDGRHVVRGALMAPSRHDGSSLPLATRTDAMSCWPHIEIETFGPLQINVRGSVDPETWKSRLKAKRFLEIMLASSSRRVTSDEAADYLWPTASPDKIRHRLHNEVSNLRKVLARLNIEGHVEVRFEHSFYRLYTSEQVLVTHLEFESLAELGLRKLDDGDVEGAVSSLKQAASRYAGAFLEDAQYDRFADSKREHLSELFGRIIRALAKHAVGEDSDSLRWWDKYIEHDPYDEDAYFGAITTALRAGQHSKAQKYMEAMHKSLVEDLELPEPDWARGIYERIHSSE